MKTFVSGALVALALSLAAAPTVAAQPTSAAVEVTEADRAEFRAALGANPMAALIMAEYPKEYAAFETQLLRDAKTRDLGENEIGRRTYEFVAGLQTAAMPYFKQATDADILKFSRERQRAMEMLRGMNPRACYEVGEGIGLSMESTASLSDEAADNLAAFAALELKTALSGRKSRVQRGETTDAEIAAVVQSFLAKGGSESYLVAVGDGAVETLTPKVRCDSAILWSAAVLAQPPAVAARIMTLE